MLSASGTPKMKKRGNKGVGEVDVRKRKSRPISESSSGSNVPSETDSIIASQKEIFKTTPRRNSRDLEEKAGLSEENISDDDEEDEMEEFPDRAATSLIAGRDEMEEYEMALDEHLTQTKTQAERNFDAALRGSRFQRLPDEDEVRNMRTAYAQLLDEVKSKKSDLVLPESNRLNDLLNNANDLLNHVHTTVDATLDSRFVAMSADLGAEKINKLASGVLDFSIADFCSLLRTSLQKTAVAKSGLLIATSPVLDSSNKEDTPLESSGRVDNFDWDVIGDMVARHWRGVHTLDVFLGPIEVIPPEKRARSVGVREKRTVAPLVQPAILDGKDASLSVPGNGLSETTRNVVLLAEALMEMAPVSLHAFVTDPNSFSRTVENLYYISFLINDNRIRLEKDAKTGDILINLIEHEDGDEGEVRPKHQAIFPMTMKLWKENIEKYKLSTSMTSFRNN